MIKRTKEHNKVWKTRDNSRTGKMEMICQNSEPEHSLYPESLPPDGGKCKNWGNAENKTSYILCWECTQRMISI